MANVQNKANTASEVTEPIIQSTPAPTPRKRPSRAKAKTETAAPAPAPAPEPRKRPSRAKPKTETNRPNPTQAAQTPPAPEPAPQVDIKDLIDKLTEVAKKPRYDSKIAINLAYILAGSSIIAGIVFLSPVPILELLNIGLYVVLPILGLLFCVGLISFGTAQMIWNMGLKDEVEARYLEIKKDMANA